MGKGLVHFPEEQKMQIAMRRTSMKTNGIGYWGALSYLNKKGVKTKEQKIADAVNAMMGDNGIASDKNITKREGKHGKLHRARHKAKPVSSLSDRDKKALAAFKTRR